MKDGIPVVRNSLLEVRTGSCRYSGYGATDLVSQLETSFCHCFVHPTAE
jgi:hypothetical protein